MKKSTPSPFESGYGFKSPGFTVDSNGNLTATSFNITTDTTVVDFIVTDDQANFFIENVSSDSNPPITLSRGKTYTFRLDLTAFDFILKKADGTTNQNAGLTHSDGSGGSDAQSKTSGALSFAVPLDAEDTLFYTNTSGTAIGTISVVDSQGLFSTVDITGNVASTSSTTGSLTVEGGVGITDDLYVGGELNIAGVGIPRLSSNTNLELNATNEILLQIENSIIGNISTSGLSIPINSSAITQSTIDNTIIGGTSPAAASFSTATFESASVTNDPVNNNDVTKKTYVDTTSIAFAIALGS
jgi:hypothetical protein